MGFLDKNKVIRLRGDNDRGGREMKIPSYPPLIRGAPKAGDQNGQAGQFENRQRSGLRTFLDHPRATGFIVYQVLNLMPALISKP